MKKAYALMLIAAIILAGCSNAAASEKQSENNSAAAATDAGAKNGYGTASVGASDSAGGGVSASVVKPGSPGDVIEIKEKLFVAQTNEIALNYTEYLGKTFKYEGIFVKYDYQDEFEDLIYYAVIRYGPGCCGNDGECGFEVLWEDDAEHTYPEQNDWVEVVGTLEEYDENGNLYLRLRLTSLKVLEERGAERVTQ